MSADTYLWVKVAHLVGVIWWVAGLVSVASLLRAHAGADAASRPGIVTAARGMALLMEVGSLLAIAMGLTLAFKSPMYPNTAFKAGAWLHVKLTIVVLGLLVSHILMRIKIGKLRRDARTTPLPAWVIPLILLAAAGAITLGANSSLLRS